MKLHIFSDLHTEFADFSPPDSDADVVILAGDIGVGLGGIEWAANKFPKTPVIYVPCDYDLFKTQIICNPRGYPGEYHEPGFRGDLLVKLNL